MIYKLRTMLKRSRPLPTAILAIFGGSIHDSALAYSNVYGNKLQSCSSDGMALTGFTRDGYCVDQNGDSGSHHICIDLSSTTGGNFCDVTGQSDWCDEELSCHEDTDVNCQIQNWCVCQWAFASYIENAGGCDYIQDVVCDSINMEAVRAYQQRSESKYINALLCIEERCGIEVSSAWMAGSGISHALGGPFVPLLLGFFVVSVATVVYLKKRYAMSGTEPRKECLMQSEDTTESTNYEAYTKSGVVA